MSQGAADPRGRHGAVRAQQRVAVWMVVAGALGALMAFLTWLDVWQATDGPGRPVVWLVVTVVFAAVAVAGVVVLVRDRAPSGGS